MNLVNWISFKPDSVRKDSFAIGFLTGVPRERYRDHRCVCLAAIASFRTDLMVDTGLRV